MSASKHVPTSSLPVLASSLAFLVVASAPARAQEFLRDHFAGLGVEFAALSDRDGDGVGDYALAVEVNTVNERVEIRSGATGDLLRTLSGGATNSVYGISLADAGDVDGDGVGDLLVGAPSRDDPKQPAFNEEGAVFVYSGSSGTIVRSLFGGAQSDLLGVSVAGIGDVDGDGRADFCAGAAQTGSSGVGYVRCWSGATGALLYQLDGTNPGDDFTELALLSDRDGDGIRDFAVGSNPEIRLCSGASGATLATIPTATTATFRTACELDDLDGDGVREIALGEADPVGISDGQVRVVSVPTLTTLRTQVGDERSGSFGSALVAVADADGDGQLDYLVGAPGSFFAPSSASLFSGRSGERLYRFFDPKGKDSFATSLADVGDLDGDGHGELLIASPFHFDPSLGQGAALLFRGNDLWLGANPKLAVPAGANATLAAHGVPAGNLIGIAVVDVSGTPLFQFLALGPADAAEALRLAGTVPPGLAGVTMTFHAFAIGRTGRRIDSVRETIAFH